LRKAAFIAHDGSFMQRRLPDLAGGSGMREQGRA
jgi:hypothetical protein